MTLQRSDQATLATYVDQPAASSIKLALNQRFLACSQWPRAAVRTKLVGMTTTRHGWSSWPANMFSTARCTIAPHDGTDSGEVR
jgi:hypothetical protein